MDAITNKCREITPDCIPEMRLLGKFLSGEPLTDAEREYVRQVKHEAREDRDDYATQDDIDSDNAGQPCRGPL